MEFQGLPYNYALQIFSIIRMISNAQKLRTSKFEYIQRRRVFSESSNSEKPRLDRDE